MTDWPFSPLVLIDSTFVIVPFLPPHLLRTYTTNVLCFYPSFFMAPYQRCKLFYNLEWDASKRR